MCTEKSVHQSSVCGRKRCAAADAGGHIRYSHCGQTLLGCSVCLAWCGAFPEKIHGRHHGQRTLSGQNWQVFSFLFFHFFFLFFRFFIFVFSFFFSFSLSGQELCGGKAGVLIEISCDLDEYPKSGGFPHYGMVRGCMKCDVHKDDLGNVGLRAQRRSHEDFVQTALASDSDSDSEFKILTLILISRF